MLGAESSMSAVPFAATAALRPVQPPPEVRVVENTARASLRQQHTGTHISRPPSAVDDLIQSARQFADILDRTGNLQVASSVSGFMVGGLDTYA